MKISVFFNQLLLTSKVLNLRKNFHSFVLRLLFSKGKTAFQKDFLKKGKETKNKIFFPFFFFGSHDMRIISG